MSEQKPDKDDPNVKDYPKEEEKVPETKKNKNNIDGEKHYPSLPPKIRNDGQEVVPWTQNPTSDFVNPYGLTLKRKKRKNRLKKINTSKQTRTKRKREKMMNNGRSLG